MDRPRDYQTESSKSEKDRYMISLMWTLKYNRNELYLQNRNDSQTKNKLTVTRGEMLRGGINLRVWD